MSFHFRRAVRESTSLIIGLAGPSGAGKTYSAMRLASGIAGDKPFAVLDTEGGRAKHYADAFRFDHGDLTPPFSPERYLEGIKAADEAGYPVIVTDSASHEWAGEGGVLDLQADEFARMGEKEAARMASWIRPKMRHKQMVQRLLQCRAHLILCMRAEEKIDMVKVDGKMKIVPREGPGGFKGWLPICERNLPYELTVSFLLLPDNPGVPIPIKPLQEQHKSIFALDSPLTEEAGRKIAEWAAGGRGDFVLNANALPPPPATDTAATLQSLRNAALNGTASLRKAWEALDRRSQHALQGELVSLKDAAAKAEQPST